MKYSLQYSFEVEYCYGEECYYLIAWILSNTRNSNFSAHIQRATFNILLAKPQH